MFCAWSVVLAFIPDLTILPLAMPGMPPTAVNFLLNNNPWMKDTPKIRKFYEKGHHWTFEKADLLKQKPAWFFKAYAKWGPCMDAHARACFPEFKWNRYYGWKHSEGHSNTVDDPGYAAYCYAATFAGLHDSEPTPVPHAVEVDRNIVAVVYEEDKDRESAWEQADALFEANASEEERAQQREWERLDALQPAVYIDDINGST